MVRARRNPLLFIGLSALLAAAGCGLGTNGLLAAKSGAASTLQAAKRAGFVTARGVSIFVEPEAGVEPIIAALDNAKTHVDLQM